MSGLPTGWANAKIADILTIRNGFAFKSSDFCDQGTPLIRQSELKTDHIDIQSAVALPSDFLSTHQDFSIKKGDILIGMSGSLGKVSVYISDTPALQNQRTGLLKVDQETADQKFALYALKFVEPQILAHGKGIAVQNVSSTQIESCLISLPPRPEQTRIVTKLEELLSDLDAGVTELKAAQKKLAQYRQSLLKAAVDGSLTAEWRKSNTPAETGAQLLERILKERRARWEEKQLAKFKEQGKTPPKDWQKKYPEPVQPDSAGLPELPEGWVWASAEQLCEFITKGTTPPKELDSNGAKVIPFLRVTNLTDTGALDLTDKVFVSEQTHHGFLARSAVYPQDVLMNIVGPPLGQVSVVPFTYDEWNINQAIAIFRAVSGVAPWFICHYLLSTVAQQWLKARSKTTAGQTNLTLEVCRNLPVPLAPQLEQDQLLIALETAISSISQQQEAIALSLKQAAAQRQNILRAAFAGQLVPQDPNDEPASVLLERIRAERAAQAKPKARGRKKVAA